MLSCRHGCLAGNHAGVMSHMMLCLIMRCLEIMEKPCSVADPAPAGGYAPSTRSLPARTAVLALIEKIRKPEKLRAIVPGCFRALDGLAKEAISLIDPSNEEKGGFEALVKAQGDLVDILAKFEPKLVRMAPEDRNRKARGSGKAAPK
ncbi:MAG: hypothetical protein PUI29_06375 [Aeromonadales bacterium]|nr:hypothetical protein [Aeromonadales bacterium]